MLNHIINWKVYSMGVHNPVGEVNTSPSQTIPDMALSLPEMLKRYVRGEKVTTFTPIFTDDPDIPDNLERMDALDRLDLSRNIAAGIEDFREEISHKRKKQVPPPEPEPDAPDPESLTM